MKHISSRQNAIVAEYRGAAQGGRRATVLLDGAHLVADALDASLSITHALVASDRAGGDELGDLVRRLLAAGAEVVTASPGVLEAASPVASPSGIVALAKRPADGASRIYERSDAMVVIAHGVQDAGNVGAIVRVAEAAGAAGVVFAGVCADPFGWKALRGSMGSALRLPISSGHKIAEAAATARRRGLQLLATVPRGGRSPFETQLTGPLAVLVGGEGAGVPRDALDHADDLVTIPMQPPVESLNTAVATAVVLYEALRQRTASSQVNQAAERGTLARGSRR